MAGQLNFDPCFTPKKANRYFQALGTIRARRKNCFFIVVVFGRVSVSATFKALSFLSCICVLFSLFFVDSIFPIGGPFDQSHGVEEELCRRPRWDPSPPRA